MQLGYSINPLSILPFFRSPSKQKASQVRGCRQSRFCKKLLEVSNIFHITVLLIALTAYAALGQGSGLLAAGEYYEHAESIGEGTIYYEFSTSTGERFVIEEGPLTSRKCIGMSRYMFDNDEDIEFLYNNPSQGGRLGLYNIRSGQSEEVNIDNYPTEMIIVQGAEGAIVTFRPEFGGYDYGGAEYAQLPGNTPEFDNMLLAIRNAGISGGNNRTDTVYVERTTRDTLYIESVQIDTVRELITERIYTSDTVYINETITLGGDIDTVVVNRTVTTRDTVYNYTENTITRVDSVYLLGGDYLDDLNRVTSIENQLEVERLGNPYPNPASETVSIDYVTEVPTTDMFLGVYDNRGQRIEQFEVRPSHTITFNVSDWAPGVYVYMIWSSVGVSSTKRLIVE